MDTSPGACPAPPVVNQFTFDVNTNAAGPPVTCTDTDPVVPSVKVMLFEVGAEIETPFTDQSHVHIHVRGAIADSQRSLVGIGRRFGIPAQP